MNDLNEELLDAWLRLSTTIINDRVVSEMPYNEALICNILCKNMLENPGRKLTATDLCSETRMLKSQMNRTLNSMEEKKVILRERSALDKRQVYITLNLEQDELYQKQHEKVLALVDAIIDRIGTKKAVEIVRLFSSISDIAEEVIK